MVNGAAVKWTGRVHMGAVVYKRKWIKYINIIDVSN
jgi:hypothetical protein